MKVYWYSDDGSIQFNFNRQKSEQNRAFYGHRSSPVFLTNILKYRLDRLLGGELLFFLFGKSKSCIKTYVEFKL